MFKEITVYSCGDSRDASTWSNVPYLFCRTLEQKGIKVNRVDISPSKALNKWFNRISFYLFVRILHLHACPIFARTWLHRCLIYRRLKKTIIQYPDSQLNLFLSFAFTNPYSDKPNVLWCDWTDRVVIERLGRLPEWYEKASLAHEDRVMAKADVVYTMFPVCKQHLEDLYHREIRYLHRNVVNSLYRGEYSFQENASFRYQSDYILFIGNHRYKPAALDLIEAIRLLRQKQIKLKVELIGMSDKELGIEEEWINCHGYLHKDIDKENQLYYHLLMGAKLFVNTTRQWAGYSSTIEAMYYGCPVIVSPYSDFTAEFGTNIGFGFYKDEETSLSDLIQRIFSLSVEEYRVMSRQAHDMVADYNWDNYVDAFLKDLNEKQSVQ